MSPDAQGVSQDVFTWLSNTYYCSRGPRPPDAEYEFSKFALEFLQSQGWNIESMAYVQRAFDRLQCLQRAGRADAANQALAELKDSINFGLRTAKQDNSSMQG